MRRITGWGRLSTVLFACVLTLSLYLSPTFSAALAGASLPDDSASPARTKDVAPGVRCASYILMDAATGRILAERNARQKRPPASTTKIITGVLALELAQGDSIVKVSKNAALTEGSALGLVEGEVITLESLLYGALLWSGNDACAAISEHIAGSQELFSYLMNGKAFLLGTEKSTFKNPHGLPAKGHYSSAYDLAIIARYALKNPNFAKIVGTKTKVISSLSPHQKKHLYNTNQLLWGSIGANGVKTGTTSEAGACLVASAKQNGKQLITVVLNSPDRYRDTIRLLEYGFRKTSGR